MARLVVLGSAYAVPSETHENTHLALVGEQSVILVDCAAHPTVRLAKAGLGHEDLTDLILTHFHPDHVYGAPLLLMNMWLKGRQHTLRVHGLRHCLERLEDLMGFYHWDEWPNFFPVSFHRLPERENILVVDNDEFLITSSPMRHFVPTMGLRIVSKSSRRVIAYSCDTEPCPEFVRLAHGADLVIHEAAGASLGHSSASQAGAVAQEAAAEELLLIHYNVHDLDPDALLSQARETFSGKVRLAADFMSIEI